MKLGRSLVRDALPAEAHYYTAENRLEPSVFDAFPDPVPAPYGSFCLEAMDAHGGWVASAVDLMRISAALTRKENPLLAPEFWEEMVAAPAPPVARDATGRRSDFWYGCGWLVRPIIRPLGFNLWHSGSLPGTFTFWVILGNGTAWAVLFNQRREAPGLPDTDIDMALHQAAAEISQWPETDLFPSLQPQK
jgi:N-acyl-D-amino-acid deacylase